MRPLEDRLVIRMLQPDEEVTTAAGIVIPEGAHEKTMFGVVVARGPGRITYGGHLTGRACSLNDVVLVGKMAGTEFISGGKKYTVIRESDVMVRWEGAGTSVHLSDEKEATGVDEFFSQRQLPAKVDTVAGGDWYLVKAGDQITFNGQPFEALRDVFVRERDGKLYHQRDGEEFPGPGKHLVAVNSPEHPNHPDHTLPRAASADMPDENRDKLPRAAKGGVPDENRDRLPRAADEPERPE